MSKGIVWDSRRGEAQCKVPWAGVTGTKLHIFGLFLVEFAQMATPYLENICGRRPSNGLVVGRTASLLGRLGAGALGVVVTVKRPFRGVTDVLDSSTDRKKKEDGERRFCFHSQIFASLFGSHPLLRFVQGNLALANVDPSRLPTSEAATTTTNTRRPPPVRCSKTLVRIDDDNDDPHPSTNTALKMVKLQSYNQAQFHEIIVIPPDDPLPSPAFSQLTARACKPPASYNALAASEAHPHTPVDLLIVSANDQDHSRPQTPYVSDMGMTTSSNGKSSSSNGADRLPATPATQESQGSLVVTPLTPLFPFSISSSPSQSLAAPTAATCTATTAAGPLFVPCYSTNSTAGPVEVITTYDVAPAHDIPSEPQHHCQHHDKQVRRGHASSAKLLLPSPTSPLSRAKDSSPFSTTEDDALVDHQALSMQPSKAMGAEIDTSPVPEKLSAREAAPDQSQNDLATQVETLTAQLNRLQRQCDQMAGLMQLKDWVTSLWMKRTYKWEAQATELERDRDNLRQQLDRTQECKVFWRRTATERLTVSQQWADLCQKQTEEIVDLKHRVVSYQGRTEMLEHLLDEAGSVASAASTELARSVDGLESLEDVDEMVSTQPQSPSAVHTSFPTRTSYMSTISAISSTSGSSAAESYTDDLDVDEDGLPSPPSEPTFSYSPAHSPALTESAELAEFEPESTSTYSKAEIETMLADLRAGQTEFEAHLIKYAADREALDQGWDELMQAQDRFEENYEAAARRAATFDRRSNMLLDQEVELDLLKRRYMDKIRNYEFISVDLKQREDRYFAGLDHVHILTEDTEVLRMHNEATERVLREEWDDVEDAWMAVWRRQNRLIRAAQMCLCACVCGNRGEVESWNDDEVPALLLGEDGRESERAKRVHAIVAEEMKKRRDEERNEGRRLRCVRDCECPECAPKEVEVSASAGVGVRQALMDRGFFLRNCRARLSIMDRLIKMDCTGWLWSYPWLHVPQVKVRGWTPLFHIRDGY